MSVRLCNNILVNVLLIATVVMSGCAGNQEKSAPLSRNTFEDIQHWINAFEDPERHKWQKPEDVIKALNVDLSDVIADIGAGTGYFTRRFAFAALTGKAIGLDVDASMVRYMKEDAKKLGLNNYEARVVKTDDPELDKDSVNIVFLCNTYHHIDNRVTYFSKVAESLKHGGRLVIVDFYRKELPYGPPPHHKLAKEVVIRELEEAGYRLIRAHDFLPYQYFLEFGV
jgi:ubiquinone/menaquinone biosynthesis C-methylase UbiE